MIVSIDYSRVKATWQSGLSREEVFSRFPEKRSWWIDSSGEVFDAGNDHAKFVKEHPELFDHDEGSTTYYAIRRFWVRISAWGPSFTINSRDINQKQLDAAQILYMNEAMGKKVEFFQDNVISTSFDKEDFLELKNVNQLKRMRTRIGKSPSDYMKEEFTDKRSWWVNPAGKIFDAGYDHNKFLEEHKKTFGGWVDINEALVQGWVRVAFWGGEYVVHCHSIKRVQLEACQEIYKSLGGNHKVFISTLNKNGYMSPHDFIWSDSQSDLIRNLFSDPTGIRRSVKAAGENRAWLVSPQGEVIDCGRDHEIFVLDNRDFLKEKGYDVTSSYQLVKDGWARIGKLANIIYIDCSKLTQKLLDQVQGLVLKDSGIHFVQVIDQSLAGGEVLEISRDEFLQMNKPSDLRWMFNVRGSRAASLPKSRNFLMGVSLESMQWPLRKAFDLLNLSKKKDKLSANQVVSVFQANDQFLQENLGRTATELIRDLNGFVQYGSSYKKLA